MGYVVGALFSDEATQPKAQLNRARLCFGGRENVHMGVRMAIPNMQG